MTLTQPCAVSGEFTFAEGQESQTFTVPIIDDHLYDGDKTVILYISNPTLTATIASPIVATLTIVNTDLPAPRRSRPRFSSFISRIRAGWRQFACSSAGRWTPPAPRT